jgi:hypothetical protein
MFREPTPPICARSHVQRDQIPCHGDHLLLPNESGSWGMAFVTSTALELPTPEVELRNSL